MVKGELKGPWALRLGAGQLREKIKDDKKKKKPQCSVCGQRFERASGLATHMNTHKKMKAVRRHFHATA